eukprot:COSAG03_NODE_16359_length_404_cov_0.885246_1_plen_74_part_10
MNMEVRLWASLRGQTLARVIHGVMQYDEALQLFAKHEHENGAPHAHFPPCHSRSHTNLKSPCAEQSPCRSRTGA